jgi:hypothetical protein
VFNENVGVKKEIKVLKNQKEEVEELNLSNEAFVLIRE